MTSLANILEASYQPNREAKETLEKEGYKLDTDLSTRENKVFIDAEGKPSIAFRGTVSKKDVFSDVLLGLGLSHLDPRQKQSTNLVKMVEEKYKKAPDVYGHSLGGALAEKSGTSGKITTFNKGVAPSLSQIFRTTPSNQEDIRTKNDLVSMFGMFQGGKKKTLEGDKDLLKTHSIRQLR